MARKGDSSGPDLQGWASTHQWISRWLEDKTNPRKIQDWIGWARKRMESGWTRERIEQRIRAVWHTHEIIHDQVPLEPALMEALKDVYKMADDGSTPQACAVVYRSLARQYPQRPWLEDWATHLDSLKADWSTP